MKTALLAFALALVAAVSAQRIEPIAPARGVYSASFSADWIRTQSGTVYSTFFATPAYFVTDHLELRLPIGVAHLIGTDELIYGFGARWHFGRKGKLVDPFIGGVVEHATARHFSEDLVAAQVGVHYFIASNVAVTTLFSHGWDRMNGSDSPTSHFVVGLSIFFADR